MIENARIDVTLLPKIGERLADCEDALSLSSDPTSKHLRVAVADGASSSAFSGIWSRLLVESFIANPFFAYDDLATRLPQLAAQWLERVYRTDLPWHAIERAKRGAFSTITAIEFSGKDRISWRAIAIGDSAMLIFRDGRLLESLPFTRSSDFPTYPMLVSTIVEGNADLREHVRATEGQSEPGDVIVLATDAVARMIFESIESCEPSLESIVSGFTSDASTYIDAQRARSLLKNDDVAIVLIRFA